MIYDQKTTIDDFLNAAAARQPVPGGGSVTALVGALAASMGEMALRYTVGKKGLEPHAAELNPALAELTRARGMLLELMVEDQAAYEALSAARKFPEGSPQRNDVYLPALLTCIRVPQAIAATGLAILGIADRVAGITSYFLLSDLAVCADLAMATVRCAIYNVRVNLADVPDEAERRGLESANADMLARATALVKQVSSRIWSRHSTRS
jgi:formiminotetrahydrofolate cyclodeaminase